MIPRKHLEGGNLMNVQRVVYKSEIQNLRRRAVAFFGIGVLSVIIVFAALFALYCSRIVSRGIVFFMGLLALGVLIITMIHGGKCFSRYMLYKRYFEATGLMQSNDESVKRWKQTLDVTQ